MKRKTAKKERRKADAEKQKLESENDRLRGEVAELKARLEKLERLLAKLQKNSSTSSKPPSSDIVKPPKKEKKAGKKLKRGAQPGHPRYGRPPFTPDQMDQVYDYRLDGCPDCGSRLRRTKEPPRILQQAEIREKLADIHEHRSHGAWCPCCEKVVFAPFPEELKAAGLSGPGLTVLVGYLKAVCHASFSTIRKFFRDVLKLHLSRGYLRKLIGKVSTALQDP